MTINRPLDAPLLVTEEVPLGDRWAQIGYGKAAITAYRLDVAPQSGVISIPESDFGGWPGPLLAAELMVETTGARFVRSWTDGDNRDLVATDTMKNFVLHRASTYTGSTVEGLAAHVGLAMLATYPDMSRLRITGRHLRFATIGTSGVALRRLTHPGATTTLSIERGPDGPAVTSVVCGLEGLRFARLRGSAFAGFPRDEYTTLPETSDRPLEIGLALRWWYRHPVDATRDELGGWVPPDAVEDLLAVLVDRTANRSIQQLLAVFAATMLDRFESLDRVWFEGENRVWSSPALPPPAGGAKVHTAALPAHGVLRFALARTPPSGSS